MLARPSPQFRRRTASRPTGLPLVALAALAAFSALPRSARAQDAGTGSIEGTVSRPEQPPRRTLDRYSGSGASASRTLQPVPIVVYIDGRVGAAAPPPVVRAHVAQQDTAFAPPVLVVPVGTVVEFPNRDPFFHNVISFSPAKRFDLGRYPRGESKSVTFDEPGVVKVYCEVHRFMRAAVVVVENTHHAIVGKDGHFRLEGVPAGRHRLVVWDAERRPRHVEVVVAAGAVSRVNVALK